MICIRTLLIRILSAVFILFSAMIFTGCFDFIYNDVIPADSQNTSPASARSTSLTLNSDGSLAIQRTLRSAEIPMGDDGTWTIFIYICGTDLESEEANASYDLSEMMTPSLSGNVKFIVETGGCSQWQYYDISNSEIQRYVVENGAMTLVDEQNSASMGESDTVSSFLNWGIENYPAANMGVVFWNHGGGSINGVCFDENNDYDSLSMTEIDTALTEVYDKMTEKFEFIGFDACLMSTVETANILVPHANYMFASEEIESGYGWDYTEIGNYLAENPGCNGAEIGKVVAESFYASCIMTGEESTATFSITDLSKFDALVKAFNTTASNMYNASSESSALADIVRGITAAANYGGNNKSEGYTNMVDLGSIMSNISNYAEGTDDVLKCIDDCVVYNIYGEDETGSTGLSIYYPLSIQGSYELNIFKEICISPYYMAFVDKIAYGASTGGLLDGYSGEDVWLSDEGYEYWNYDDYTADYWDSSSYYDDSYSFNDVSSAVSFSTEPHFDSNGTYTFTISQDTIDNTESIYCNVLLSDDDGYSYDLGIDNYIDADWTTGVVSDCFDGYWYTLADGQPLAVYIIEEQDDYDIYTSPIMLNGNETNLRIRMDYTEDDYSITLIGAWDGIDENGQAAKTVVQFKEGDVIAPLYDVYDEDGNYAETIAGYDYIFQGDSNVYEYMLAAADYLYSFQINDIFGTSSYTEFKIFEVDENGDIWFYS